MLIRQMSPAIALFMEVPTKSLPRIERGFPDHEEHGRRHRPLYTNGVVKFGVLTDMSGPPNAAR